MEKNLKTQKNKEKQERRKLKKDSKNEDKVMYEIENLGYQGLVGSEWNEMNKLMLSFL